MIYDIPGYEGYYKFDYDSKYIISLERKEWNGHGYFIRKSYVKLPTLAKNGYLCFNLSKNGIRKTWYMHQVVMLIKEGHCPEGMEVCHNDGNKLNNTFENLRYDTKSENQKDKFRHGMNPTMGMLGKTGIKCHISKKIYQFDLNGTLIGEYFGGHEASRITGVSYQNIWKCLKLKRKSAGGYIWSYGFHTSSR